MASKAKKQHRLLPPEILESFETLLLELQAGGPVRIGWRNYRRLRGKKGEFHHCHLNSGKPRYVAIWEVLNREIRLMEIRYVGTHEKAPY